MILKTYAKTLYLKLKSMQVIILKKHRPEDFHWS